MYAVMQQREKCFVVISKQELKLYVCEVVENDTVRLAEYPVCLSRNLGQKERVGDLKTPESTWEQPFSVSQIQDASGWVHDFGDGRGSILAYGNWFIRLKTPGFSGIGIHGSTNNESSVPGRASEGCIRLRNADLDLLKEQYAFEGMKVVIKREDEGLRAFERKYY
ncbi:MAG: L,D-transpeptidase [Bacteroidales bacterium]|nr:L,D-transpeptidase [Bacteroidales bacterium]